MKPGDVGTVFAGARVDERVPLAPLTTLRVGPVASRVITCTSTEQVVTTLRHLDEGEVVYAKDRPADAWYGVVAGAIRLGASGPDGRQGLLTFLAPGAWFGDTSLFDRLPRPHDAIAHCATTLLAGAIRDGTARATAMIGDLASLWE